MKKLFYIILVLPLFGFAQTAELKGVVTYYFNQYQGNKPDVGSKIYIHKILKEDSIKSPVITLNSYQVIIGMEAKLNQSSTPSNEKLIKQKAHIDSLNLYNKVVEDYVGKIKSNKESILLSVDGVGNYSVDLLPGFYEVIVESKGRSGLFQTKTIEVKKDRPNILDFEFSIVY